MTANHGWLARLAACAVAAGLITHGVGTANADIIYTMVDQTYTVNSSNTSTNLNLLSGSTTIASLVGSYISGGPNHTAQFKFTPLGGEVVQAGNNYPDNLSSGTSISSSSNYGSIPGIASYGSASLGNFRGVSDGFLGFSFTVSSQTYYGYVELANVSGSDSSPTSATLEAVGYAYNSTAGAAINAGQMPTAVPEPSQWIMMGQILIGGGGYALYRRRRSGLVVAA